MISIGLALLALVLAYTINPAGRSSAPLQPAPESLDLNEASFHDLLALPGIGPALAQRIILYRERHGPFYSVNELIKVEGIGPKLLQKLENRLKVREWGD